MKYRNLSIWKNVDKPLFLFYFTLSIIGYLVMYSSNYNGFEIQDFLWITNYGKQLIWLILTFFFGVFILLIDGNFIKNSSYFIYGIVILLLVIVLFMPPIKGATSWFYFSSFSIQPSELIKLGLSLALAKLLSDVGSKFQDFRTKLKAFFIDCNSCNFNCYSTRPRNNACFFLFCFCSLQRRVVRKLSFNRPFYHSNSYCWNFS